MSLIMITKEEYLKHEILEQGHIHSNVFKDAYIEVCSRIGCEDYTNIIVKYVKNTKEIYFRLIKGTPTIEQFKDLIVFDKISENDIEEVYKFITSHDSHSDKRTVYDCAKVLFNSMEYAKIPLEQYRQMNKDGTINDYTGL